MYFQINKNSQGKYWWQIRASGNHEILAVSELLDRKSTCLHAIDIVKQSAFGATIYDNTGE